MWEPEPRPDPLTALLLAVALAVVLGHAVGAVGHGSSNPEGFREPRHSCLLSDHKAAAACACLGACMRTIRRAG